MHFVQNLGPPNVVPFLNFLPRQVPIWALPFQRTYFSNCYFLRNIFTIWCLLRSFNFFLLILTGFIRALFFPIRAWVIIELVDTELILVTRLEALDFVAALKWAFFILLLLIEFDLTLLTILDIFKKYFYFSEECDNVTFKGTSYL